MSAWLRGRQELGSSLGKVGNRRDIAPGRGTIHRGLTAPMRRRPARATLGSWMLGPGEDRWRRCRRRRAGNRACAPASSGGGEQGHEDSAKVVSCPGGRGNVVWWRCSGAPGDAVRPCCVMGKGDTGAQSRLLESLLANVIFAFLRWSHSTRCGVSSHFRTRWGPSSGAAARDAMTGAPRRGRIGRVGR